MPNICECVVGCIDDSPECIIGIGPNGGLCVSREIVIDGPGISVTGDGSSGSPYIVTAVISADAGNLLVFGSDDGLYVDVDASEVSLNSNCSILVGSSTVEEGMEALCEAINNIEGGGLVTVSTSAPITGDGTPGNPIDINLATVNTDGSLRKPYAGSTTATGVTFLAPGGTNVFLPFTAAAYNNGLVFNAGGPAAWELPQAKEYIMVHARADFSPVTLPATPTQLASEGLKLRAGWYGVGSASDNSNIRYIDEVKSHSISPLFMNVPSGANIYIRIDNDRTEDYYVNNVYLNVISSPL